MGGERGIALENLCTQIYEDDVLAARDVLGRIAPVGKAMGLESKYWEPIAQAGRASKFKT